MPLVFEPGYIRVNRDPLGVALIIGAWNEPFMLVFGPLVAALAAGNTAVLKPSEIAAHCAAAAAGWCRSTSTRTRSRSSRARCRRPRRCWRSSGT